MAREKLTAREEALLAEARREAAARSEAPAARPAQAPGAATPKAKPAPTPAERLEKLMADERAETLEKKKKMRRYGLAVSGGILALFALWVLRAFRSRR